MSGTTAAPAEVSDTSDSRAAHRDPRSATVVRWGTWAVFIALVASAVAMAELDRLIEQFLSSAGQSFSMSGAEGLPPMPEAWAAWAAMTPSPAALIAWHAGIDVIFSLAYCLFGVRVFLASRVRVVFWFWVPVAAAEVLESILILFHASGTAIALASWTKWAALLLCLGTIVFVKGVRDYVVDRVGYWARAFFVHRVSLVIVVALGLFALLPKGELFDQYPDAIRIWSDPTFEGWRIAVAVAVFLFLSVIVFVFARRNTAREHYARTHDEALNPKPGYVIWFTVPTLFALAAIVVVWVDTPQWGAWALATLLLVALAVGAGSILALRDPDEEKRKKKPSEPVLATFGLACGSLAAAALLAIVDGNVILPVDGHKLLIFVFLAMVIPAVSLWLPPAAPTSGAGQHRARDDQPKSAPRRPDLTDVASAGQVLAALAIAVFGLGFVRAFVAPQALVPGAGWWVVILLGIAAAALALIGVDAASRLVESAKKPSAGTDKKSRVAELIAKVDDDPSPSANLVLRYGSLLVGVGLIALFISIPLPMASGFEVVTTVGLVLIAWLLIVGNADAEAKDRRSLPVWERIGLASDPVVAVLLVGPILLSQINFDPALHAIERQADAVDEPPRTTLEVAFSDWVLATAGPDCEATAGGTTVRPLVLLAAEGGGIRAAAWTARVLDELVNSGTCAPQSVFLSSGASGGSVGLVIAQGVPSGDAYQEAAVLARSPGLAADVSGLLVGDVVAGATGVRVPTEGYPEVGPWVWQDRAAHLQWEWRQAVDAFEQPYDHDLSAGTGWLMLNTTAVGYDCRAVISQLDVGLPPPFAQAGNERIEADGKWIPYCAGDRPGVANTIDVEALYEDCPLAMDWATAAMTSARFPIITPAGRTSAPNEAGCEKLPDLQLADGGIAENSGLANIADLAPELTALIRDENAKGGVPIVPLLVYASNEPGKDLVAGEAGFKSELGVATSLNPAQSAQNSAKAWMQRIADSLDDVCPSALEVECGTPVDGFLEAHGDGVFLIAPRSQPAIAVPLGWVLSDLSIQRIDTEISGQCATSKTWPTGYAGLKELHALLGGDECLEPDYYDPK